MPGVQADRPVAAHKREVRRVKLRTKYAFEHIHQRLRPVWLAQQVDIRGELVVARDDVAGVPGGE